MKPGLNENDIIFVKDCNNKDINIGDVITFSKEEEIITHRVIDIIKEEETIEYITKGDNNEIEDNFIVQESEIYGKMILSIPKIGRIAQYIQNTNGFINLTIIILTIFIFISLNDKKKNMRRTKRRKYEIKRLRDNYN